MTAMQIVSGRAAPFTALDTTTPATEVTWLIPNVVAAGCVTLLSGAEKAGKSLCALQMAAASGRRVAVFDAENGEAEILRRLALLPAAQRERVTVFPVRGIDVGEAMDALRAAIIDSGARVIVLDTWRSLWRGSEARGADIVAFLEALRTIAQMLHVGIILLHHVAKGGDEYRGRSEIGGIVELLFTLSRSGGQRRTLTCTGSRVGAEPAPQTMELGQDGVFRAVAAPTAPTPAQTPPRPATAAAEPRPAPSAAQMNAIHRLVDQKTMSRRQARLLLGETAPRWRFWA